MIYDLFISPIETVVEWAFLFINDKMPFIGILGAIIGVSIVINFLALPLYNVADSIKEKERAVQLKLQKQSERIKKAFKGDERFMMNADTLFLAKDGLNVSNRNPFTGKEFVQKKDGEVHVYYATTTSTTKIYDKYKSSYKASCDKIADERNRFASELEKISGITVYPSQANYIMCKYTGKKSVTEITENLLQEHNLLVKNLTGKYGCGEKFMRLAVISPSDNDALVAALRAEISE